MKSCFVGCFLCEGTKLVEVISHSSVKIESMDGIDGGNPAKGRHQVHRSILSIQV